MAGKELEFSTRLTREDVAGLVEAMVEGLKDGRLRVQKSDEVLELEVPRVVDLEIEAKIDDERAEFEIEISWRTNRAENPDTEPDAAAAGKKPRKTKSGETKTAAAAKPAAVKPAAGKTTKTAAAATGKTRVAAAKAASSAAKKAPAGAKGVKKK